MEEKKLEQNAQEQEKKVNENTEDQKTDQKEEATENKTEEVAETPAKENQKEEQAEENTEEKPEVKAEETEVAEKPEETKEEVAEKQVVAETAEPAEESEQEDDVKDENDENQEDSDTDEEEEDIDLDSIRAAANEEFDWDKYEKEEHEQQAAEDAEIVEMYTKTLSVVGDMELVKATVVNITEKDVVLNIGYKSDGLVARSEFKYMEDLKVGDEVDVIVESTEGKDGQILMSHRKALAERAWDNIVKAHESQEIVNGFIKDRTKGGMVVDLFGLDAFLPGSQLDIKPVTDYDAYVGKDMELKVVKLNPAFRNIVVSHKAIIEADIEEQKSKILSKLEKGQVLEGIVKNLTSFGVFVDLGGVDGLIHITDVSWGRINHPNEMLEIGQKINVVVLDYDEEKNRISLGMKQLTPHPWEKLPEDIQESSVLKGKVVNIEDYGAFIEIFPGVEGLVHVSEMTWSSHLKSPSDYLTLGQEAEVKVLSILREERKLSLGIKQLSEDPWTDVTGKYPKESKHNAIIRNITNFGLFVELEEGIDGLIHVSDLSWTKKYNHPSEFAKVGDIIECMVLEIDEENRRLSLGHKQLEEDPWDTYKDIFLVGSEHEGSINTVDDKGAVVILPYNVEGFCPARQLSKENNEKPKKDEVMVFQVIEFDKSNRRIVLSHTNIWKEAKKVEEEEDKVRKKKTIR
jgi:small subunit ribosomal protein S1